MGMLMFFCWSELHITYVHKRLNDKCQKWRFHGRTLGSWGGLMPLVSLRVTWGHNLLCCCWGKIYIQRMMEWNCFGVSKFTHPKAKNALMERTKISTSWWHNRTRSRKVWRESTLSAKLRNKRPQVVAVEAWNHA